MDADESFELIQGEWDNLKGRAVIYSLFAEEIPATAKKKKSIKDRIVAYYITHDEEDMRLRFGLDYGSRMEPSIYVNLADIGTSVPFYASQFPVDLKSKVYKDLEACINEARTFHQGGRVAVEKEDILYGQRFEDIRQCTLMVSQGINFYLARFTSGQGYEGPFSIGNIPSYRLQEKMPDAICGQTPAFTSDAIPTFLSDPEPAPAAKKSAATRAQPRSLMGLRNITDFEKTLTGVSLGKYLMEYDVIPLIAAVGKRDYSSAIYIQGDMVSFFDQSHFFVNGLRREYANQLIKGVMVEGWAVAQSRNFVEQILEIQDFFGQYPV